MRNLNAVKVTVSDLRRASDAVHALPEGERDWEGRLIAMVRLFPKQPDKGLSVEHRLAAMAKMVAGGALPGWSMPEAPDGSTMIAEAVWLAAASEPLVLSERDATFDCARFRARVLSLAQPEGSS